MASVAGSQTSTRSKSSKRNRTVSQEPPRTPDGREKLTVNTGGLHLEMRPPRPEFPAEILPVMLGDRTRRSRCTPEFLLEMSARDPSEFLEQHGKKLKIITGPEAVTFYRKFLGGSSFQEILGEMEDGAQGVLRPCVVFAVAVEDAGRRCVNYYATWSRKESAHDAVEAKQMKFFHSQFRKTSRALDSDFKRANGVGLAEPIIPEKKLDKLQKPSIAQGPMTAKARPPSIAPPPQKMTINSISLTPASATDSVMSLPYLDFIRNVPNGHRLPLRVTNPDNRLSTLSPTSIASPATPTKASQQPTIVSVAEKNPNYFTTPTPFSTPAPTEKLLMPEAVKRSNSSTRSSCSQGSAMSSAASTSTVSKETYREKHKAKEMPHFIMVLLDGMIDKEPRTWHGLERQNSRSTPQATSRVSLWDGPLARESGHLFAYPPRPDGEESSEEEEDFDNSPVIPPPPSFFAIARSRSEPRYPPPAVPPNTLRYGLPVSLGSSPIGSFANLPYGSSPLRPPAPVPYPSSPYAPGTYVSPYQSPAMSRSVYLQPFQQ